MIPNRICSPSGPELSGQDYNSALEEHICMKVVIGGVSFLVVVIKIPMENGLGEETLVWLGAGGDCLMGSGKHGPRSLLTSTSGRVRKQRASWKQGQDITPRLAPRVTHFLPPLKILQPPKTALSAVWQILKPRSRLGTLHIQITVSCKHQLLLASRCHAPSFVPCPVI